MDPENLKIGKVVLDKWTNNLFTIEDITKSFDEKDTYVRGKLVNDPNSENQIRHINDIEDY